MEEKLICPFCGHEILYDGIYKCSMSSKHKIDDEIIESKPNKIFDLGNGINIANINIIYSDLSPIFHVNIIDLKGRRSSYLNNNKSDILFLNIKEKKRVSIFIKKTHIYLDDLKNNKYENKLSFNTTMVGQKIKKEKKTYIISLGLSRLDFAGFEFETSDENLVYRFVDEYEKYRKQ